MTYDVIKWNYEQGLWDKQAVQLAVRKGIITDEQAKQILAGSEGDA